MKKSFAILLVVFLTIGVFAGCGKKDEPASNTDKPSVSTLADGIYFAQEDGFAKSGWKYVVTLEVKDGKIISADWNGAHTSGGKDKKTSSKDGDYGMVAKGGASAEWHEQAEKTEAYLIEKQDPNVIKYTTDEGNTDDIAGVTIHVVEFFDLVKKALAQGPVGTGKWQDGTFHAEEPAFEKGYKYSVDLTVINGYIISANWDGIAEEGNNKKQKSVDGEYVMNGAKGEWHEQAAVVEAFLLDTQDPTAVKLQDGKSDDIAGASITVAPFFTLAQEALKAR